MTKVLLIYEKVPEDTLVFLLNVSDENLVWMKKCHRKFVNSDPMTEEMERLSLYLEDRSPLEDKDPVDIKDYDLLIVSGFLL